jgi:putative flippase GtrA
VRTPTPVPGASPARAPVELLRFAVAGVIGLLADIAVLYLALALGLGYYAGRVLSFLAAVWVTWQLNRHFTFAPTGAGAWREFTRYLGAMVGGGLLNYLAYSAAILLLPHWPLTPALAVAVGSLAGMALNFLSAKLIVFKR